MLYLQRSASPGYVWQHWAHQIGHFAQAIGELVEWLDCLNTWGAGTGFVQEKLCVPQSFICGHLEACRTAQLWHSEQTLAEQMQVQF